MKKIINVTCLTVLALSMLLPVTQAVNAASVNHPVPAQGGAPFPPPPPPPGH